VTRFNVVATLIYVTPTAPLNEHGRVSPWAHGGDAVMSVGQRLEIVQYFNRRHVLFGKQFWRNSFQLVNPFAQLSRLNHLTEGGILLLGHFVHRVRPTLWVSPNRMIKCRLCGVCHSLSLA
jgi:hypothetical protein